MVMDFGDRTHLLVFIITMLAYTTLALGLAALGARNAAANARLLHAIQLLDATVLELPMGTVKSRLAYGLATLRSELAENSRKRSGEPSHPGHSDERRA